MKEKDILTASFCKFNMGVVYACRYWLVVVHFIYDETVIVQLPHTQEKFW